MASLRTIHLILIHVILVAVGLFYSSPSSAALINSNEIYAAAGFGSQSTQFTGESRRQDIIEVYKTIAPQAVTARHNNLLSTTQTGFVFAQGFNEVRYGVTKFYNRFTINDLTLSYSGQAPQQNTIRGAVHVSQTSSLSHGAKNANSSLSMALNLGSGRNSVFRRYGADINQSGVWETWFNFTPNSTFNLSFSVEMLIANSYLESGSWRGEGHYSAILGGSPVFNLPEGYSISSADGSIVDNYFVGNRATSVPEPQTLLLFTCALIFFAFYRTMLKHRV